MLKELSPWVRIVIISILAFLIGLTVQLSYFTVQNSKYLTIVAIILNAWVTGCVAGGVGAWFGVLFNWFKFLSSQKVKSIIFNNNNNSFNPFQMFLEKILMKTHQPQKQD